MFACGERLNSDAGDLFQDCEKFMSSHRIAATAQRPVYLIFKLYARHTLMIRALMSYHHTHNQNIAPCGMNRFHPRLPESRCRPRGVLMAGTSFQRQRSRGPRYRTVAPVLGEELDKISFG